MGVTESVPSRRAPAGDLASILAASSQHFERLRGERIFVTGGTGFVGRWLMESLLGAHDLLGLGVRVSMLTRDPERFALLAPSVAMHPAVELVAGDVRTFEFGSERFDRVLHLAAETNTTLTNPEADVYVDVIVGGTRQVLDAAARAGVRNLLVVSSGAVYGRSQVHQGGIAEDAATAPDPADPSSAYGESKRLAELLAYDRARRGDYSVAVARCFAFTGPHLPVDSGFAIGNFIRDAAREGEIIVKGDGSPLRSYLYASDMAIWLWAVAVAGVSGRPYNVGSDESVSIGDLARLVARAVGENVSVRVLGDSAAIGAGSAYVPDVQRARAELGVSVTVPLRTAIDRSVAWHRGVDPSSQLGVR
jgi:nucleoside-diphosphate-sugar epimerase